MFARAQSVDGHAPCAPPTSSTIAQHRRSGRAASTCAALTVAVGLFAGLSASLAHAQGPLPTTTTRTPDDDGPVVPPKQRLYFSNLNAIRYNPLGLFEEFRVSYRHRMYEHEGRAFRDNFVGIGAAPSASPAWVRLGLFAEIQPTSFLLLTAQYDWMRYFGNFNLVQSFPDARANFSDSRIKELGEAGGATKNYVTTGHQVTLSALLQFKFGPIAFRSNNKLAYFNMNLRAGDTVFYEQLYDLLVPGQGWMYVNDVDLLWLSKFGFMGGLRYSVGMPIYNDQQLPAGATNENGPTQRLGPFLAYTFNKKPLGTSMFNNPTLILLVQWWLDHRWRTGRDVSQAAPLIGLAFTFNGDFWSK